MPRMNFYNVLEAALAGNCVGKPVLLRLGPEGRPLAYTLVLKRREPGSDPYWVLERYLDQGVSALQLDDIYADSPLSDLAAIVAKLREMQTQLGPTHRASFPFTVEERAEIESHHMIYQLAYMASYPAGVVEADKAGCEAEMKTCYAGDYKMRDHFIMARRLALAEFEEHLQRHR